MLACLAESRQRSAQPYAAYLRPNFEVKDNEKTNTFQIFPDFFIKNFTLGPDPSSKFLKDTLSRGLAPALKRCVILSENI